MITQRSRFEEFLATSVGWDVAFRLTLWIGIAVTTAYLVVVPADIRFVQHFANSARTLMPVLRHLGALVLGMTVFAILLKDFESRGIASLHRDASLGRISGILRRISSDLCLWLSSSCTTLLSLMGIAIYEELRLEEISEPERAVVFRILKTLGVLVVGALLGHVLLKSERPRTRFGSSGKSLIVVCVAELAAVLWLLFP